MTLMIRKASIFIAVSLLSSASARAEFKPIAGTSDISIRAYYWDEKSDRYDIQYAGKLFKHMAPTQKRPASDSSRWETFLEFDVGGACPLSIGIFTTSKRNGGYYLVRHPDCGSILPGGTTRIPVGGAFVLQTNRSNSNDQFTLELDGENHTYSYIRTVKGADGVYRFQKGHGPIDYQKNTMILNDLAGFKAFVGYQPSGLTFEFGSSYLVLENGAAYPTESSWDSLPRAAIDSLLQGNKEFSFEYDTKFFRQKCEKMEKEGRLWRLPSYEWGFRGHLSGWQVERFLTRNTSVKDDWKYDRFLRRFFADINQHTLPVVRAKVASRFDEANFLEVIGMPTSNLIATSWKWDLPDCSDKTNNGTIRVGVHELSLPRRP